MLSLILKVGDKIYTIWSNSTIESSYRFEIVNWYNHVGYTKEFWTHRINDVWKLWKFWKRSSWPWRGRRWFLSYWYYDGCYVPNYAMS